MNVDRLLVLTFLNSKQEATNPEDFRDGMALAVKHVHRHSPLPQPADDPDVKTWETVANGTAYDVAGFSAGQIGKHNAYVIVCKDGKPTVDPSALNAFFVGAKSCGVYVLVHGRGGMTTPYKETVASQSPQAMAKIIGAYVPDTVALKKVNLVACTLAQKLDTSQADKKTRTKYLKKFVDEKRGVENFVAAVCSELKRKETMVAGYTVPVYVVRDKNPEFTTFGVDGDDRPKGSTIGQKAAHLPKAALRNEGTYKICDDNRGTAKSVYQFSDKAVKQVSVEEYHAYH